MKTFVDAPTLVPVSNNRAESNRHGVTLIEVVVSLILVSTILLVSITASASLIRNRVQSQDTHRAHELLGELLDEVSVRAFQDPDDAPVFGLESGEDQTDRSTLDDVDDYDGYTQSPPRYRDGNLISGFDQWTVAVSVQRAEATAAGINVTVTDDSSLRLVQVTCTAGNGATKSASLLVSNVATNLPIYQAHRKMLRARFQFPDQRDFSVSVPLRNLPDPN